jgi:hypothetical protein
MNYQTWGTVAALVVMALAVIEVTIRLDKWLRRRRDTWRR